MTMMMVMMMMVLLLLLVVVVVVMVVMMMGMAKFWGSHFLRKTFCRSFPEILVSVLLVSWWSMVFRWFFVCGTLAVCLYRTVLTVLFPTVLGVLLMFWWCFCGVSALFRWCLGGIESMAFSWLSWLTSQYRWRQRKGETLLLGLYVGLIPYKSILVDLILINSSGNGIHRRAAGGAVPSNARLVPCFALFAAVCLSVPSTLSRQTCRT